MAAGRVGQHVHKSDRRDEEVHASSGTRRRRGRGDGRATSRGARDAQGLVRGHELRHRLPQTRRLPARRQNAREFARANAHARLRHARHVRSEQPLLSGDDARRSHSAAHVRQARQGRR